MNSIYDNLYDTERFEVSCTLDVDDETMNNPDVIEKINGYKNASIAWGTSISKINAVNRDVPNSDWDIVVVGSDDIFFCLYGFDEHIRIEMRKYFPEGDGYLHFSEKDTKAALNVMTCIDRIYYNRFGWIYHPAYKSLWCDNQQTDTAKILGRYRYIDYEIFHHFNPAYNYPGMARDEMFNRQQADWSEDEATYYRLKAVNFEL